MSPTPVAPSRPRHGLEGSRANVSERPILDASDRAQRARWEVVWAAASSRPGLFRAAVALGVRALARDPHARWSAVAQATASVVRRVRHHARAVPGVVGAASARQRQGDRRGAALGCRRGWASPDGPDDQATVGNGPRMAASGTPEDRGSSRVRDPAARGAGRGSGCGRTGGSDLGDAVEAMMLAVRAFRLRFGAGDPAVGTAQSGDLAQHGLVGSRAPTRPGDGATREWVASLAAALVPGRRLVIPQPRLVASDQQRKRSGHRRASRPVGPRANRRMGRP